MLAATVTVVPGSLGAGSLDSTFVTNGGQLPLATPDVGGDTLSTGALTSMGAASDIVVAAQGAITFDKLGSVLSLQTGSGNGVSFNSAAGAVTFAGPSDSLATAGGRITLEAGPGAGLTVANLNSKGGEIDLFADRLSIDGAVNAGPAALVHLDVRSAARPITVGSSLGSSLDLPETALNQLTAGVLEIGDTSDIGGLTVTAPIALSTSATGILNTFNLRNGGPIAENAGGSIAVYALALQSGDGVNLARASNVVSHLAFVNTGGNVTFANAQTLAIASVDGLTASSNTGATTNLTAAGPLTFAATVTSAGTLTAKTTANANPAAPVGVINVSANATVESTTGDVVLESVSALDVPVGANVLSDTGTVQLSADFTSASVTAGTEIQGTVNGTSLTVHGGSSLLIDFTSGAVLPHGLTFSGGTNASLTIADQGGAAALDYVINGSSVVRDGAAPIKFGSGTAQVTVDGGDSGGAAGDTFNVTPSANIAFTLNGGLPTPPANPGDVLIAPAGGTLTKSFDTNSGFSGTWKFTGDQPITFAGFETLKYPPTITSAGSTTFTVGSNDNFVVATDGLPSPTVTQTGTLPGGVTFDPSTDTLGGTPSNGAGGVYHLSFDATNGIGADAPQSFTLTVNEAPAFSSSSAAVFAMGMANSFNVTASGFPAPTLTELGTLPNGVSFNAATGLLKGTPALGTNGVYSITFTASNGVGGNATQNFTLLVTQPQAPAITSAASVTFTAGTAGTFTVTASGTPTPTLSETGALPAGVTFDVATGVLSGTASSGTGGTYSLTFQASNGAGSASQNFLLTVAEAASITSANGATFTPGTQGSFVVTAGGYPVPTLSESGPLPGGVTFDAATGSLSGTPAPGTDGIYAISFSAHNGIGSDAMQSFTLAVDQAPAFTSASAATFTVGSLGSFAVTASGFPAPTIGESGALPNGVTFDAATGTLSGTPGQGTGGTYAISFSASNGFGTAASQSFTFTVDQAPAVTSANSADFVAGLPGSFKVTATGFPAPALSESGNLPGGVTFDASTGMLSGTPDAGAAGTYDINFTATNGVGSDAAQPFTLTVDQPQAPSFASPGSDIFTVGVPGTFTVAAAGTPAPSLSESGPLPGGVTFDAATGALAGTPGLGTSGTYVIQFTAANGVGSNAVQDFTLTVDQAPSIASVNAATFIAGSQGSFTVTAGGFPAPSLSESGALPANVTFDPSSGMLAGVPAAGTGGTYDLSFTAHNGVGSDATQSFTLTVDEAPSITSVNAATFTAGAQGSFTLTTGGFPSPILSEAGALPAGVTFDAATGLLSGTPNAGTGGTYAVSFAAHNGMGSDATQNFTLTVDEAPSITSPAATSFAQGFAGSFTVTAGGFPTPSVSESGTLPNGVTFDAATNTLSGTSGSTGTFPITFTAHNGIGADAVQSFTLTVAPTHASTITSATSTTFKVGTAGSFRVIASGVPTPTLSESGALPGGVAFDAATGLLTGTPAAGSGGAYDITFTAGNGVGSAFVQNFVLDVDEAPSIASGNATTFAAGTQDSFAVTAGGFPAPVLSESGALPNGVSFDTTSGTLAGTPAAGAGGTYAVSFRAHNGIGADAVQSFTLTVNDSPSFTSAASTTFTVATPGSFVVAPGGFPTPSLIESGALPTGVSFDPASGTLSGKPAAGTGGTYNIAFTAHNGVGSDATQNFTLTVDQAAAFTSAPTTIFGVGVAGSFTVTTSGFPAPSVSETGALPNGVTFDSTLDKLSGTPAAGTNGNYNISFTAHNGVGSDATQNFTLTVDVPAAFTSAPSATFTVGLNGSFVVTASGVPAPTLSETGTLPSGVSFNAALGQLSGKPAAGAGGTYDISFTAHNGIGSDATQNFTLSVDQPPAITSTASSIFTVGTDGNFVVTTTGFPSPTLSETGALPTGVTFNAATGALAGTPAAATGGKYPISFTAHNGVGSDATQNFTLTVDQAPAITSAASATFTAGATGSFVVTASGVPAPTLSETGTLPSGVTFNPANGTLGGRPAAGTGGTYNVSFTAHNGVGSDATQNFTLTVDQAPAITSAASSIFTVGTDGNFVVTTSGFPTPTVSESGALPTGVTFDAATLTLSGTPAAAAGGKYPISFTATNGVGNNASQSFTLDVGQAPVITSAAGVTFTVGAAGSFAVTASGFPTPSLAELGTLPTGVAFNAANATLSGKPTAGTGGTYNIDFVAHNGVGNDAVQNFVLTIDQPPAITSGKAIVFDIGVDGAFMVTASGFPAPTFSEVGTLPAGLNFNSSGLLTGTAAPGTTGSYSLTFTAHNGVGNDAKQTFTLFVVPPKPTANADTFVLSQSATSAGSGSTSVLANDVSGDGQPQDLVATLVTKTSLGRLVLNHDGSFAYAPGSTFQGLDRFSYQVSEGPVTGTTVSVTILSYQASIVDKLYHQVLGRSPDDKGLQYWTSLIMHGASYSVVAQGIFESDERLTAIIAGGQLGSITYPGYYPQFLLRPADAAGLAYWEGVWKQDGGPDNVIAGMIGSPEFYQSAGMQHPTLSANAAWVTALYERLLSREPETAGLNYWTGHLDDGSMTRQDVVLGFVRSTENFTNLTDGFFEQYLNRAPSASELALYVAEFGAGATQRDIQLAIINLPEYANTPPPPAAGTVGLPLYPY